MTRDTAPGMDRHRTTRPRTTRPAGTPTLPGRDPRRTTGGLVVFAGVAAAVLATAFAPVAMATVAAVVATFAVALAVVGRADGRAEETDDPDAAPTPPDGVPAD